MISLLIMQTQLSFMLTDGRSLALVPGVAWVPWPVLPSTSMSEELLSPQRVSLALCVNGDSDAIVGLIFGELPHKYTTGSESLGDKQ